MPLWDISVPIREGMHIYTGNPGVEIGLVDTIADDGANVSNLSMGLHTGTHIDGPSHFIGGAGGVEELDLDAMIGPCRVIDVGDRGSESIGADCLEAAEVPAGTERLLIKSSNSRLWERAEFTEEFTRLDGTGAQWILDRGIRLVGIDYLSIGDPDAHRRLLSARTVALEGLDLRAIEPGSYFLHAVPIRLPGCDGAPCRALLADSA